MKNNHASFSYPSIFLRDDSTFKYDVVPHQRGRHPRKSNYDEWIEDDDDEDEDDADYGDEETSSWENLDLAERAR